MFPVTWMRQSPGPLGKSPAARFQSISAFAAALDQPTREWPARGALRAVLVLLTLGALVALSLRFLMLFASFGAMLGGLMMFWAAGTKLARAAEVLVVGGEQDYVGASIMIATDSLLFGVVLLIFAYAIAFGFVFQLSEANRTRLPAWMHIQGIAELKVTLVQVILVYLTVDFATDISEPGHRNSWETLVMPIAILLLSGALRLMSSPATSGDVGGRHDRLRAQSSV